MFDCFSGDAAQGPHFYCTSNSPERKTAFTSCAFDSTTKSARNPSSIFPCCNKLATLAGYSEAMRNASSNAMPACATQLFTAFIIVSAEPDKVPSGIPVIFQQMLICAFICFSNCIRN